MDKNFESPRTDFMSNRQPKYEVNTNSILAQQDSYQFYPHPYGNESLLLPHNTDSIELSIKVKFKDNTPEILRAMDPPLYTSPWRSNSLYNYKLPSPNRTQLEFMELPSYNHRNFQTNSAEYSTLSYKPSLRLTDPEQNTKNQSFQKQRVPEPRRTNSIDYDNPLFPKSIGSGLLKTQSNTYFQTKRPQFITRRNLNNQQPPLQSPFNTIDKIQSRTINNSKYVHQQHPSVDSNFLQSRRQSRNSYDTMKNPGQNSSRDYETREDTDRPQEIKRNSVQQISHKQANSQQFPYPINEDYQPLSVDQISEHSREDLNNNRRQESIGSNYPVPSANNFTIKEEEEPNSNSQSKQNSIRQSNNSFGEGFRQTVSIVPPESSIKPSRQSSSIKPSSNIDRPSSIQQSFEVREPSQFQNIFQFKRTSSILPSQHDGLEKKESFVIGNTDPRAASSIQNPVSLPNTQSQLQRQSSSELMYSQTNRPSQISNSIEPLNVLDPLSKLRSNEFNLSEIPSTTLVPVQNTNFNRSTLDFNPPNHRRSSRSPERQIFTRPFSQLSSRNITNLRCPYRKLGSRARGITLTKYQKKVEDVEVPERIIQQWSRINPST